MFNVAVLTPSSGKCEFKYAISLANLVLYFCSHKVYEDCNEQGIQIIGQQSFSTSCNREMLIDYIMDKDFSHVLFIDDDMEFEPSVLNDLAKHELPVVACDYPRKNPFKSMIAIGLDDLPLKMEDGLEQAKQIGFGMALIKRDVIERIEKPRFPVLYNTKTGSYSSEDFYFSMKLGELGIPIYVDHDASKKVGHIGSYTYK